LSPARLILRPLALAAAIGLMVAAGPARAASSSDAAVAALGEEFLARALAWDPGWATSLGVHERDRALPPVTLTAAAEEAAWLRDLEARVLEVPPAYLGPEARTDRALLLAHLGARRAELEDVRRFERDPGIYLAAVEGSIHVLLAGDHPSACERVQAATARLRQVPEYLRTAQLNLRGPSRIRVELAVERCAQVLRYYRERMPGLGAACRDPRQVAGLAEADSHAVHAVGVFMAFLREDVLPQAPLDFAVGEPALRRMWGADKSDLDSLAARAGREAEALRTQLRRLVADSSAPADPRAALRARLSEPIPDLADAAAAELERARSFAYVNPLVTQPEREELEVRVVASPPALGDCAVLRAPGVWESKRSPAWLEVDGSACAGRGDLARAVAGAGVPGRHLATLALRDQRSRLRQALAGEGPLDGWEAYVEQVMVEQGYADRRVSLRAAEHMRRLVELARLRGAIAMHARGATLDSAIADFEREAWLGRAAAEREARRVAAEPWRAGGTLARWRILDLRTAVARELGPRFQLARFHDEFLRRGCVPGPGAQEAITDRRGRSGKP
jgi:uncharacterized protein (DUF885 family)